MKKMTVLCLAAVMAVAAFTLLGNVTNAESEQAANGDYQRAVGIAKAALSDCLAEARKAGNTVSDSGFPGANEGDWSIVFCGTQTPTQSPAQFIGGVAIEGWDVVEANCEFPSPTSNPCPTF